MLYGATGNIDSTSVSNGSLRLMYDASVDNIHFEFHHLWSTSNQQQVSDVSDTDRFNLSYANDSLMIKAGRQPINLSHSFFFTPNDFFNPFAALAYNKDFKPGVDAIFIQKQMSTLSSLSAYVVDEPNSKQHSTLIEYESVFGDSSWSLLAGDIQSPAFPAREIIGGTFQTDIFDSISLRIEGHQSSYAGQTFNEWVIGTSHLWQNELSLNLEFFHHGANSAQPNIPYSGHSYGAIGISYPYNPLLQLSANILENLNDHSRIYSAVAGYSMTDNLTANLYLYQPQGNAITTEFGRTVAIQGIELLYYF